jgi:hypothetical protein
MQRDDDSLSDRKKSQEAKYKMDEERRFKIRARRNKLLGLWLARRIGLDGEAEAALGKEAVIMGMDTRTEDEFLARLAERSAGTGGGVDISDLKAELGRCEQEAERQIAEEFPSALAGDHAPVGDSPHRK